MWRRSLPATIDFIWLLEITAPRVRWLMLAAQYFYALILKKSVCVHVHIHILVC